MDSLQLMSKANDEMQKQFNRIERKYRPLKTPDNIKPDMAYNMVKKRKFAENCKIMVDDINQMTGEIFQLYNYKISMLQFDEAYGLIRNWHDNLFTIYSSLISSLCVEEEEYLEEDHVEE